MQCVNKQGVAVHDVTCGSCRKEAAISAPSDVWKCPHCGDLNEAPGTEDNSAPGNSPDQEIAALEARLLELRGDVAPKGDTNV